MIMNSKFMSSNPISFSHCNELLHQHSIVLQMKRAIIFKLALVLACVMHVANSPAAATPSSESADSSADSIATDAAAGNLLPPANLAQMSIGALRGELKARGLECTDCVEKPQLVAFVREHWSAPRRRDDDAPAADSPSAPASSGSAAGLSDAAMTDLVAEMMKNNPKLSATVDAIKSKVEKAKQENGNAVPDSDISKVIDEALEPMREGVEADIGAQLTQIMCGKLLGVSAQDRAAVQSQLQVAGIDCTDFLKASRSSKQKPAQQSTKGRTARDEL
jgi:hypothetical protein